jgi:hypothetical protein
MTSSRAPDAKLMKRDSKPFAAFTYRSPVAPK